jgi:DUF1680 family protein
MRLRAPKPTNFALRLRIPAWTVASRVAIRVNGQHVPATVQKGFASVTRTWADNDRIELQVPMPMRLEAIDAEHPDTVALMRGPLVLFAMTSEQPTVTRHELEFAAKLPDEAAWRIKRKESPLLFRPFFLISDETYLTYVKVRG